MKKCVKVGGSGLISEGVTPTSGRVRNEAPMGFKIVKNKERLFRSVKVLKIKSLKMPPKVGSFHII